MGTPRHNRTANILFLDIETAYMEVRGIWNLKTDYIRPNRVVKDWSILCWGAKWFAEPQLMGQVVTPQEAIDREEHSIIGGIWKLVDKADIVVTQNGTNFDHKRLNTKFLKWRLPKPSPYVIVDTLKIARDNFGFTSNSLDELGKNVLGIGGKIKMTEDDWDRCTEGSKEHLTKMLTYCKRDVSPLLEDLYLYFLPWIKNQNLNIYTEHDKDACPNCESADLSWTIQYPTPQGLWNGFRCNACGSIGRGTTQEHNIKSASIRAV
jgi:prepilin-type processing-associated H-X9-DG protein